jgi:hypothetical protein
LYFIKITGQEAGCFPSKIGYFSRDSQNLCRASFSLRTPFAITTCRSTPYVRREQPLASEALYSHRYRFVRLLVTAAFAAWIGCADILATESASADSGRSQLTKVEAQFRLTSGVLPAQFCRFVPCRSSARTIEATDQENDRSTEDSSRLAVAARPNPHKFTRETLTFHVESPDRLIELPGTPPPVAIL